MALRWAPLTPDKVTLRKERTGRGEIRAERREGGQDPPERVNKAPDRFGRTLFAWLGLMVIPCFMPGNLTRLYVTIR